jgi:hypothetical protein
MEEKISCFYLMIEYRFNNYSELTGRMDTGGCVFEDKTMRDGVLSYSSFHTYFLLLIGRTQVWFSIFGFHASCEEKNQLPEFELTVNKCTLESITSDIIRNDSI